MEMTKVMKALETIKKGTFTHFEYKSELPVKAKYKKLGYKIIKETSMTARFGINYSNIHSVMERKTGGMQSTKPHNPNFSWVLKNLISFNSNTNNNSLHVYTCNNTKSKSVYYVYYNNECIATYDEKTFKNKMKDLVIDSYWNKTNKNEVFQVNVNNVIAIGGDR